MTAKSRSVSPFAVRSSCIVACCGAAIAAPKRSSTGSERWRRHKAMPRSRRFLIGGVIILGALAYMIYGGMQQAMVYFKMPSELRAEENAMKGKFVRMGGMVVQGSLQKDLQTLTYRFQLTDGSTNFPVYFKGVPPDLFSEGKGAVVEGRVGSD